MKNLSRADFLGLFTKSDSDDSHFFSKSSIHGSSPVIEHSTSSGINPYTGAFGREQVLHLIRRTLFGVTHADYHFFSKLTLDECLDVLLTPSSHAPPPVNLYNDTSYTDPEVPYGKTWVRALNADEGIGDRKRIESLMGWMVGLLLNQDRSVTEKMILFWHNHVAAEFNFMNGPRTNYTYIAQLRQHAMGNFKELILDITTCTGMLIYLSGNQNTAKAPNENYARELQELFTVGKGKGSRYTQGDVMAAARILTGWNTAHSQIDTVFLEAMHDTDDKQFSAFYNNRVIKGRKGKAGAEELNELIDMLFAARETALHTCRCLYRWFINSTIDDTIEAAVIEPLADILIKSNYEIIPVLRALLGSDHFFDPRNIGCQIKNPVDHLIGLCRQFNLNAYPSDLSKQNKAWYKLSTQLSFQSMCPGAPPNVAGWPAYYLSPSYYKLWINSDTIMSRYADIDVLLSQEGISDSESGISLTLDILGFTSQLSEASDIDQLIADSTTFLSPVKFDASQLAFLKTILLSGDTDEESWSCVWTDYAAEPDNVDKKNIALNRLSPFYNYLLQQMECQLT